MMHVNHKFSDADNRGILLYCSYGLIHGACSNTGYCALKADNRWAGGVSRGCNAVQLTVDIIDRLL